MNNPEDTIISFVMEQVPSVPNSKKIQILRALSCVCKSRKKELSDLADDFSVAESRCRQFAFDFQQKTEIQ